MKLNELLFRTTGIMTKKCIMRKCAEVGKSISLELANNGTIQKDKLTNILTNIAGKRSSRYGLIFDSKCTKEAIIENSGMSEKAAEQLLLRTTALGMPKGIGKKSYWCFPMDKRKNISGNTLSNVAPHELEHVLFKTFSFNAMKDKFITKCYELYKKIVQPKTSFKEIYGKNSTKVNAQMVDIQDFIKKIGGFYSFLGKAEYPATREGLLQQCKCKTIEELHEKIRAKLFYNNVLDMKNDKNNYINIELWLKILKDESRAYKIGGQSESNYKKLIGENSENGTKSEMISLLYDEAIKVLKQEKKFARQHMGEVNAGLKADRRREIALWRKEHRAEIERKKDLPKEQLVKIPKEEWSQEERDYYEKLKASNPEISSDIIKSLIDLNH